MDGERMDGGRDGGASRAGDEVVRTAGPWTPAVHHLLAHLEAVGFDGAPRPRGANGSRERLTYVPGRTVGSALPWPAWAHADDTLEAVADWLRRYHAAVADYVPPADARWREGGTWEPGAVVGHRDAAPYNAVLGDDGVAFVDWDMAGPTTVAGDVAWVLFSWAPLHARRVVEAEGFTAHGRRRARVELFLRAYGWAGTVDDALAAVADRVVRQVEVLRANAAAGDPAYVRMLELGRDRDLLTALAGLPDV